MIFSFFAAQGAAQMGIAGVRPGLGFLGFSARGPEGFFAPLRGASDEPPSAAKIAGTRPGGRADFLRAQEVGGRRALKGGSLEEDGGAKLAPLENPPTAHAQPPATIRQLPKHPPRWHTAGNDIIQRKEKERGAIASRPFSFLFHTPAYAGEVRSPGSGGAAIPGGFPRFCFSVVSQILSLVRLPSVLI